MRSTAEYLLRFHSTKEGFKVGSGSSSIKAPVCFHSTKEGFKAVRADHGDIRGFPFPFHQGRFQGVGQLPRREQSIEFPFHQGRFQGSTQISGQTDRPAVSIPPRKVSRSEEDQAYLAFGDAFPFHQGRFQGRSATSAPMFVQYSTSLSEKSVQDEKAASPCKQAVMQLSQTCVDPPPFSRHRGATHSLQEHTSKI